MILNSVAFDEDSQTQSICLVHSISFRALFKLERPAILTLEYITEQWLV